VRVSAGITSGNIATVFSVLYGTFHFHRLHAWSAVVVTGVIGILILFVGILVFGKEDSLIPLFDCEFDGEPTMV